jgi:7-cyano-7-deazaguanine reductase
MSDNTFRTDGTLDTFPNDFPNRDYEIEFVAAEFTSVCPMTGQPDFGTITVQYVPSERCIELRSFKYYLFAFRNRGIFYENVVNEICDDIVAAIAPRRVTVIGDFNARGGITARVTASHNGLAERSQ